MTYLLLITPDAEPLVARWRAEHDWTARHGIPAHVTVRTPFLPRDRWGDPSHGRVLDPFLPTSVTLARLEDRRGALVIMAEPDEGLWQIADATTDAWPDLPAHKGWLPDPAFHLTVVRTPDAAVRHAATEAIAPQLPLSVAGTAFWAADDTAAHQVVAGS